MISVSIEGRAGKMLGENWRLHVGTVGEAVRALRANTGAIFEKALGISKAYVLVVDGVPVESSGCLLKKIKKSLCFIPVLAGGVTALYYAIFNYLGTLGITMAYTTAMAIAAFAVVVIVALVAYGIYSLIMAMQDKPQVGNNDASRSFVFTGAENVSHQGGVVPVAYGRLRTGSKVISVSSTNVDRAVWEKNSLSSFVAGNVTNPDLTPVGGGGGGGGGIGTPSDLN